MARPRSYDDQYAAVERALRLIQNQLRNPITRDAAGLHRQYMAGEDPYGNKPWKPTPYNGPRTPGETPPTQVAALTPAEDPLLRRNDAGGGDQGHGDWIANNINSVSAMLHAKAVADVIGSPIKGTPPGLQSPGSPLAPSATADSWRAMYALQDEDVRLLEKMAAELEDPNAARATRTAEEQAEIDGFNEQLGRAIGEQAMDNPAVTKGVGLSFNPAGAQVVGRGQGTLTDQDRGIQSPADKKSKDRGEREGASRFADPDLTGTQIDEAGAGKFANPGAGRSDGAGRFSSNEVGGMRMNAGLSGLAGVGKAVTSDPLGEFLGEPKAEDKSFTDRVVGPKARDGRAARIREVDPAVVAPKGDEGEVDADEVTPAGRVISPEPGVPMSGGAPAAQSISSSDKDKGKDKGKSNLASRAITANMPATQAEGIGSVAPGVDVAGANTRGGSGPNSLGYGRNVRGTGNHAGIDIGMKKGTPITSPADGTVLRVDTQSGIGYGKYVDVEMSDGTVHRFAHLDQQNVKVGQQVKAGQEIGKAGSSGTSSGYEHLHLEVFANRSSYEKSKSTVSTSNAGTDLRIDPKSYYSGAWHRENGKTPPGKGKTDVASKGDKDGKVRVASAEPDVPVATVQAEPKQGTEKTDPAQAQPQAAPNPNAGSLGRVGENVRATPAPAPAPNQKDDAQGQSADKEAPPAPQPVSASPDPGTDPNSTGDMVPAPAAQRRAAERERTLRDLEKEQAKPAPKSNFAPKAVPFTKAQEEKAQRELDRQARGEPPPGNAEIVKKDKETNAPVQSDPRRAEVAKALGLPENALVRDIEDEISRQLANGVPRAEISSKITAAAKRGEAAQREAAKSNKAGKSSPKSVDAPAAAAPPGAAPSGGAGEQQPTPPAPSAATRPAGKSAPTSRPAPSVPNVNENNRTISRTLGGALTGGRSSPSGQTAPGAPGQTSQQDAPAPGRQSAPQSQNAPQSPAAPAPEKASTAPLEVTIGPPAAPETKEDAKEDKEKDREKDVEVTVAPPAQQEEPVTFDPVEVTLLDTPAEMFGLDDPNSTALAPGNPITNNVDAVSEMFGPEDPNSSALRGDISVQDQIDRAFANPALFEPNIDVPVYDPVAALLGLPAVPEDLDLAIAAQMALSDPAARAAQAAQSAQAAQRSKADFEVSIPAQDEAMDRVANMASPLDNPAIGLSLSAAANNDLDIDREAVAEAVMAAFSNPLSAAFDPVGQISVVSANQAMPAIDQTVNQARVGIQAITPAQIGPIEAARLSALAARNVAPFDARFTMANEPRLSFAPNITAASAIEAAPIDVAIDLSTLAEQFADPIGATVSPASQDANDRALADQNRAAGIDFSSPADNEGSGRQGVGARGSASADTEGRNTGLSGIGGALGAAAAAAAAGAMGGLTGVGAVAGSGVETGASPAEGAAAAAGRGESDRSDTAASTNSSSDKSDGSPTGEGNATGGGDPTGGGSDPSGGSTGGSEGPSSSGGDNGDAGGGGGGGGGGNDPGSGGGDNGDTGGGGSSSEGSPAGDGGGVAGGADVGGGGGLGGGGDGDGSSPAGDGFSEGGIVDPWDANPRIARALRLSTVNRTKGRQLAAADPARTPATTMPYGRKKKALPF